MPERVVVAEEFGGTRADAGHLTSDLGDVPAELRHAVAAALDAAGVLDGHLAVEIVQISHEQPLHNRSASLSNCSQSTRSAGHHTMIARRLGRRLCKCPAFP